MWDTLGLSDLGGTIACDLKVANILVGLMASSCTFPCPWCTAHKDSLLLCGELRKIKDCIANAENWKKMEVKEII